MPGMLRSDLGLGVGELGWWCSALVFCTATATHSAGLQLLHLLDDV